MSKKDQFKNLLSNGTGTGSAQKTQILQERVSPSSNPGEKGHDSEQQNQQSSSSNDEHVKENFTGNPALAATAQQHQEHESLSSAESAGSSENHSRSEQSIASSGTELDLLNRAGTVLALSKQKKAETHVHRTFMLDKKLVERLEALTKIHGHGFKTLVINEGLRMMLDLFEKDSNSTK